MCWSMSDVERITALLHVTDDTHKHTKTSCGSVECIQSVELSREMTINAYTISNYSIMDLRYFT